MGRQFKSSVLVVVLLLGSLMNASAAFAQGPPPGVPGRGPVVLEGELDVVYEDDENTGRLLHFLNSDNRRIPLRFQNGSAPDLPTGTRVRITGDLAEGTVTTTSVTTLATSASRTLGPQSVLVILFNFTTDPSQPFSSATVASVNDQVRNFYLENTYGQTVLSFTVAGWFTINANTSVCDYSSWATAAEAAATSAGFNLAAYDRRVFAFPRQSVCAWSGMGNLAGPRSWSNGSYTTRTIAHEQGHNFGNHHSKALTCDSSGCATVEYGDDRDVLGMPGVVAHMNAYQKERLGWLNYGSSPAIRTVSSSGDYRIDNYETIAGATKALKIWNVATNSYYYVESRANIGFDSSAVTGVTIHASNGGSFQVDLDKTTTAYDATLNVGQVFTDGPLSIQTLDSSLDGAVIRVTLGGGGSSECTTAAPVVVISSSTSLNRTVTVTNKNGASCPASSFILAASVPSGWSAVFSPTSIASLASGASASSALTLVPSAGASGTFSIGVTASDTASGLSGSASTSVVLTTTPSTPTCTKASPDVSLAPSGSMSYQVTVTNRDSSGCAASSFNLGADVPSGWSGVFSPRSISSLSPGASASSTLTLVAAAGSSGTYSFSVTATDTSGSYSGSAGGSVVVLTITSTSLNVALSASITGSPKDRVLSAKITVKNGTASVRDALVYVVVTAPSGATLTASGTTAANGNVNLRVGLGPAVSGTFQVKADVTGNGMSGSATTTIAAP